MAKSSVFCRVSSLGMLPICSYCKRIRDDKDYWSRLESYLSDRSDVEFTHGICPECFRAVLKDIDEVNRLFPIVFAQTEY